MAEEMMAYYELHMSTADGENGYYLQTPEIWAHSKQPEKVLKYQLRSGNGFKCKGEAGSERTDIGKWIPGAGDYVLDLWLEDKNENVIPGTEFTKQFVIDSGVDVNAIRMIWDSQSRKMQLLAEDQLSGVEGIYYKIGDNSEVFFKGSSLYLSISDSFEGHICASVLDRAGNRGAYFSSEAISPRKKQITEEPPKTSPVDTAPEISAAETVHISGITDYQVTNQDVCVSCDVKDLSDTEAFAALIVWEDLEGKNHEEKISYYPFRRTFSKEGYYRVRVQAGNVIEERQFIIDKTPPLIEKIADLEGKTVEAFRWQYDIEQFVDDYSSFEYEVQIDSDKNILWLRVQDAAGNCSEQEVAFSIRQSDAKKSTDSHVGKVAHMTVILLIVGICVKRILRLLKKKKAFQDHR